MQSMNFLSLPSLGARWAKDSSGHRTTWAMWSVALLLAVLSVAVPVQQSASAHEPPATVTITVNEDSIDYETATATITVTGAATLYYDACDADHRDADQRDPACDEDAVGEPPQNWYVSVTRTHKESGDKSEPKAGGPGESDPDFEFGEPDENGVFTATIKVEDWSEDYFNPGTFDIINSLFPGSDYVVEAVLGYHHPNYRAVDKDTDEFTTKGECVTHADATTLRNEDWHGTNGISIERVTHNSMVVEVNIVRELAPVNSGLCIYYTMTHGKTTVARSAFVYSDGSNGRIGWILPTGLKSGTYYDFTIGLHPKLDTVFTSGAGDRTLGPRLTVIVDDIEQTSAKVTVTLPEGGVGEELVHLAYYKAEYQYEPDLDDKKVTPPAQTTANRSTSFDLETLTPGTAYWVDVSTIAGFPIYETKSEPFTTKAPNPSIGTVTVDLNSITQTEATATVSIDHPNDEEQTILLQYRTLPSGEWSTPAKTDTTTTGSKNFRLEELTGNTEYEVQAWLQTDVNNKVKSLPFTTSPVVPEAPDITSVTHGDRELTVTWTAPTGQGNNGGADIEYFVVQWKPNTVSDWASPLVQEGSTIDETVLTYPITGLSNGTTYDIRVRADNGVVPEAGQDYNWDEHFGTPDVLPEKPTIQSVVEGHTQLVVTWNEPANTGSNITGYVLQWKSGNQAYGGDPAREATKQVTKLSHEITGLDNDTEYTVRVRAVNGLVLPDEDEDDYNWSDEEPGTPRPEPIVTGVTVADATITRTSATATVTIENETADGQTVHLQYRKTTSIGWTPVPPKDVTATATSETFTLRGLTGNTNYVVEAWLATTDNIKEPAKFKTGPVEPDAPRNVAITGSADEELTVAWDPRWETAVPPSQATRCSGKKPTLRIGTRLLRLRTMRHPTK